MAIAQSHYRFGIASGTESTHGWHANENTNPTSGTIAADTTFLIRFNLQASGGVAHSNWDSQLTCNRNGGAFQNVTTSSTIVRAVTTTVFADAAACTKRLSGTGTFESSGAGCSHDGLSGGAANDIVANGCSETEYAVQIRSADVANGDVIQLRLTSPDGAITYTVTPSYTVSVAVADSRARATWGELEVPNAPRRAVVAWGETEAPSAPRRALATFGELESPDPPAAQNRAQVYHAELEAPNAPRRATVAWGEVESPAAPRRALLLWGEAEAPTAPRRALVSFGETEVGDAARRALVRWAEAEASDAPRATRISWAELEVGDVPSGDRRAVVSSCELEGPYPGGIPCSQRMAALLPRNIFAGSISATARTGQRRRR